VAVKKFPANGPNASSPAEMAQKLSAQPDSLWPGYDIFNQR
jgi:hypothetical protein